MLHEVLQKFTDENITDLCVNAVLCPETLTKGECFKLGMLIGEFNEWDAEYGGHATENERLIIEILTDIMKQL